MVEPFRHRAGKKSYHRPLAAWQKKTAGTRKNYKKITRDRA
jgi:hypothetical protein